MTSSIKASELINALEKSHWKQKEAVEQKAPKKQVAQQPVTSRTHEAAFLITVGFALGVSLFAYLGWLGVIGGLMCLCGILYLMNV